MSELSELELYRKLAHSVEEAENCARGIAQHRGDARWFGIGQALNVMRGQVQKLAIGKALGHSDSVRLLDEREMSLATAAGRQRYAERVSQAARDFKTGN